MNNKEEWIISYLKDAKSSPFSLSGVSMLDEKFVNEFIEKFDSKSVFMVIGAPKCSELSKLLGQMYSKGILIRFPMGVKWKKYDGEYPKWVYMYELNDSLKQLREIEEVQN